MSRKELQNRLRVRFQLSEMSFQFSFLADGRVRCTLHIESQPTGMKINLQGIHQSEEERTSFSVFGKLTSPFLTQKKPICLSGYIDVNSLAIDWISYSDESTAPSSGSIFISDEIPDSLKELNNASMDAIKRLCLSTLN